MELSRARRQAGLAVGPMMDQGGTAAKPGCRSASALSDQLGGAVSEGMAAAARGHAQGESQPARTKSLRHRRKVANSTVATAGAALEAPAMEDSQGANSEPLRRSRVGLAKLATCLPMTRANAAQLHGLV